MTAQDYKITPGATRALSEFAAYTGPRVTIVERIGESDWSAVKRTVETLGAVYVPNASAWDFAADQDARTIVAGALTAGRVLAASAAAGFVPTPLDLARDLVAELGELHPEPGRVLRVLEPSAGVGPFVRAILRDGEDDPILSDPPPVWLHVDAVECEPRRATVLRTRGHGAVTVHESTFEAFADVASAAGDTFDRVIMNPPFSIPGHADLWADHVLAAWELLAPGGRLVAIVPDSVGFAQRGKVKQVRELVALHGDMRKLDRDAFAASGTGVQTRVLWLDRPAEASAFFTVHAPVEARRWAWRTYPEGAPALAVPRLILTRAAAGSTPVQVVRGFAGLEVWRYVADCHGCCLPVWDGGGDIRNHYPSQAGCSLDPADFDAPAGAPAVALCGECGNTADKYAAAERDALLFWSTWTPPAPPAPVAVPAAVDEPAPAGDAEEFVSGWGQLELFA